MNTTPSVLLAEFLGTVYLCFSGIAAILSTTVAVGVTGGLVAIALAHGLALSVAVHAFGGISGAHFNPAVTAGMLILLDAPPEPPTREAWLDAGGRR